MSNGGIKKGAKISGPMLGRKISVFGKLNVERGTIFGLFFFPDLLYEV